MDTIINFLEIIFLAAMQGVAEFLPISSSAHLIIFRKIFGLGGDELDKVFDIALHFGTFLAILVYFFKEFLALFLGAIKKEGKKERKMLTMVGIGIIPAVLAGFFLEEKFDILRENLFVIALALAIMGIIIYVVDLKRPEEKSIEDISYYEAAFIGLMQIFALIPGFSRSGTTIAAGRAVKLKREDSAKFSFYLAMPLVFGAFLFVMLKKESINVVKDNLTTFALGIFVSFLVGLLVIGVLLKYLRKNDFKVFMHYRLFLAFIIIVYLIMMRAN